MNRLEAALGTGDLDVAVAVDDARVFLSQLACRVPAPYSLAILPPTDR